ncbi:T9SS type A sorting domain-containing protein [Aquimarina sp. ERC-38]|uniref:T9SS type A sorting domain-containing protein n=1 Tax=Aquimarina sp. ERC-38 TaxID=2949996 RepID=UPI0022467638|nr:T9SS type A sorting domain-containing protein [Aquimarina sp. ERC-38]UZO80234.1 T9SS type A sorting domain-containing protein [Aquimarina sp. ERC-38]
MKIYHLIIMFIIYSSQIISQNGYNSPLKAFPTAFGAGSKASGGRGGDLIIVNTDKRKVPLTFHSAASKTDAHYTGGLYAALQHPNPAYIIFDRSMVINLDTGGTNKDFGFSGIPNINNKTIFGQSAPQGGVTITGGNLRFDGRNGNNQNLIIRFIKSRPIFNKNGLLDTSDDNFTYGLLLAGANNSIVDHCSFSFAQDKAFTLGATDDYANGNFGPGGNFTFSNNIVADSNTGCVFGVNKNDSILADKIKNISILQNIFNSVNRTPNMSFEGNGEIINNIIHNTPTKNSNVSRGLNLNHISNYYSYQDNVRLFPNEKKGWSHIDRDVDDNNGGYPLIYSHRNYYQGILDGDEVKSNDTIWAEIDVVPINGGKFGLELTRPVSSDFFVESEHKNNFPNKYQVKSAQEAFTQVLTSGNAGANSFITEGGFIERDSDSLDMIFLRTITMNQWYDANNTKKWKLPKFKMVRRDANYDTDKDGMSDAWEIRVFGDLSQSYNDDCDGDGYTNIEEFYNQVDYGSFAIPCYTNCNEYEFTQSDPTSIKNESSALSTNWTKDSQVTLETVREAFSSSYAVKLKANVKSWGNGKYEFSKLTPNTEYLLFFDAKSLNSTGNFRGSAYVTYDIKKRGVYITSADYENYRIRFRTGSAEPNSLYANKTIYFYPTLNNDDGEALATLWVDNFKLLPINLFAKQDPTNANVEKDELTNWIRHNTATIKLTDDSSSGDYAVQIKSNTAGWSEYHLLLDNLIPGETYTFSFDGKSINTSTGKNADSYVCLASNTKYGTDVKTASYDRYQFDFVANDSGISQINFFPTKATTIGNLLYIDNVRVIRSCTSSIKKNKTSNIEKNNKNINEDFWLYPNPVQDKLIVQMNQNLVEKYQIQIFDLQGRLLIERLEGINNNKILINTNVLPNGSYFVRILSNGESNSKMFIKK